MAKPADKWGVPAWQRRGIDTGNGTIDGWMEGNESTEIEKIFAIHWHCGTTHLGICQEILFFL